MTAAKLMKCELILNRLVNTAEVNTKIYQEIPRNTKVFFRNSHFEMSSEQ